MTPPLSETQARLLADQIARLVRKWEGAHPPLDKIYLHAAKHMASLGKVCGFEFTWSPAGVSWRKATDAVSEVPADELPEVVKTCES